MRIYAQTEQTYYKVNLSPRQVRKYDNGTVISCGLTIPRDAPFSLLKNAAVVSKDEWNHSSCQSRCKNRGDSTCQW